MAEQATADGGEAESGNKQVGHVRQIEQIVVDPDDIVRHYTKNLRLEGTGYTPRKFRLAGFRSDGVARVEIGVDPRDEGGYYDGMPHPVWLSPGAFIEGAAPGESGLHEDIGLPDAAENKRIMRETTDHEEGTPEFEQAHEESMAEWERLWEAELRNDLKDEIEFAFGERIPEVETIRHTVPVEYEESE